MKRKNFIILLATTFVCALSFGGCAKVKNFTKEKINQARKSEVVTNVYDLEKQNATIESLREAKNDGLDAIKSFKNKVVDTYQGAKELYQMYADFQNGNFDVSELLTANPEMQEAIKDAILEEYGDEIKEEIKKELEENVESAIPEKNGDSTATGESGSSATTEK